MDLSARLDLAMKKAGYTSQSALARSAGVSQSAVNRILKGAFVQGPDTVTIAKLAVACGVAPEYLISGMDSKTEGATVQTTFELVYLTAAELRLITLYRESTIAGKRLIESMAENAPKQSATPPTDDE
jgi:transcriptional regulator with XRE-family HTH domain